MEAVAVVGLISNVLQFVELGFKLLSASKEMYGAGNEATQSNRDLEFMSRELKRLSRGLVKDGPPSHATDDERILLELADKCEKWADDMLAFLARLKNKNPESKLAAFKASVRNYSARHERSRLKEGLNDCRVQLDVQLNIMARSDILKNLDNLTKSLKLTREDVVILKRSAKSLEESVPGLEMRIGSQFLDQLRGVLQVSDEMILEAKRMLFINALRNVGMEDRFYHVEPAHAATFKWLLEEKPGQDHEPSRNKNSHKYEVKREIRDRFVNWLRNESGIFQISGKPGAGKSTLMKFLCNNELTWDHLKDWSKDKQLIFAKSFFWRLGKDTQTLISLKRSLLHQVLSAAKDLIPIAFPSRWKQVDSHGVTQVQLGLEQIEQGFYNLLTNQKTFETHKLVFFIDGLDEYKGRHIELVKKLFSWTSSSAGNLKICVSSREWNEFMVGFSECPKLRIHEYTYEDILTIARDQLKTDSQYPTLVNNRDMGFITRKIAFKAEGVFQWVCIVLNAVKDGILNGDNTSELNSKIDSFPNELGDLYQHLFDSIHQNDRQKAFETLRMTSYVRFDCYLPLIRVWFLNKVIDEPNYAIRMKLRDASDEEVVDILKIARRQIYGRCKGFLMVQDYPEEHHFFSPPLPNNGEVSFMHSTAYEFLEQSHIKQIIDQVVGHTNVFDRICQTFLAYAKFARPEWYDFDPSKSIDAPFNEELSTIFILAFEKEHMFSGRNASKHRVSCFVEFLKELETTIIAKRGPHETPYKVQNCIHAQPSNSPPANMSKNGSVKPDMLIKLFAFSWSVPEFFQDVVPTFDWGALREDPLCLLLGTMGKRGSRMKVYYERLCLMLEWCFSKGVISPDYPVASRPGLSLVDSLLHLFIYRPGFQLWYNETDIDLNTHLYPLRLLELCLRYGARPQLQLLFFNVPGQDDKGFVRVLPSKVLPISTKNYVHEGWLTPKTSPLIALASRLKGKVTIRDLTELWFPHDYKVLQELIDRNEQDRRPEIDIETRTIPSYFHDEPGRNWSESELGEDLFQWHIEMPGFGDIVDCTELDPDKSTVFSLPEIKGIVRFF
ncbi:hypothetical protein F4805DRAFT_433650 [Annulohypoxylon moriforme]|nr:hypothetical protein F4805DRAFT_433650 [Annulohypoxylon moriforme]